MPVSRVSLRLGACALALVCMPFAHAEKLPLSRPRHETFRDYMATLGESDFAVGAYRFEWTHALEQADDETLYRYWIGMRAGYTSGGPSAQSLNAPAKHFTLEAIESGDTIRCFHAPESAAWWVQCDVPGNPFFGSAPVKRRAMVMAMVNMMLLDPAWEDPAFYSRADGLAENIMAWAYAYVHAGDVLPAAAREAYEQSLRDHIRVMARHAPRDVNTNMDTREIVVLAIADGIFGDRETHDFLVREARRMLFGRADRTPATSDGVKGMFHPAGYIGEKDGPETSYNGISLYHLLEAAMVTRGRPDWDAFMPELIDRMLRFKAYNSLPDPDGFLTGPSSWAKRTNNPYPQDQRAKFWRQLAAGMLSGHGLYLVPPPPDRADMLADIRKAIALLNTQRLGASEEAPPPARKFVYDWPDDLPYAFDHYVPGSYARFRALAAEDSALLRPPFARDGNFSICFDQEFWIAGRDGWGFQVETVADMGHGYDNNHVGALAGGSLCAFWTRDAGSVVIGRLPDKFSSVTWDGIDMWTANHLWGRDRNGVPFSSARNWRIYPYYEHPADPGSVFLRGTIGEWDSPRAAAPGCDVSKIYYDRAFERNAHGLRVTSRLETPFEPMTVSELWETIPVFLRDKLMQKDLPDTRIQFLLKADWREVLDEPGEVGLPTGEPIEGVEAVRLERFEGAVAVRFDRPRRVMVHRKVWDGAYQSRSRIRNVLIDLLPAGEPPLELPRRVEIGYTIGPARN